MSDRHNPANLPPEQQAIRAKCFHPTGNFVEFTKEEIEQSIPARFEEQVCKHSSRLAVKAGSSALTYEALNYAANRLARAILSRREEGQEPIAMLFEKGAALITAILGALKANKPYVLLDASYPSARIGFILEHSQATFLLTDNQHLPLVVGWACGRRQIINIDELDSSARCANPGLSISPDSIAWIHYTSGSTGEPKGVIQNHRNALHVVMTHTNDYHISVRDRLTFIASRGGDVFLALLNGASVFPIDLKQEGLIHLAELLIREAITVYGSVTSTFRHFVASLSGGEKFLRIRLIKLSGEPLYNRDVELYRQYFSQDCILVNRLNGVETGTFCQYFIDTSTRVIDDVVPVGHAAKDKEILLLGDDGKEVGINQIGEIVVKSRHLSPGYWRKPELTEAVFLPDSKEPGKRTYRTGDLGRKVADGCLTHLGRRDFQVKIRGNRVEISEVETALLALNHVREAVVVGNEDASGTKRLVAYIVATRDAFPTVSELRQALATKLPDYMIPSAFVMMDSLPLTGIGKVDRKALQAPPRSRPTLDTAFAAPRTSLEKALINIWTEVLDIDSVGIHDNFLDLGGNSLLASQAISRVLKTFRVDLSVRLLLESPTVADMAALITQSQARTTGEENLDRVLAEVEKLSDAEAESRFAGESMRSDAGNKHD